MQVWWLTPVVLINDYQGPGGSGVIRESRQINVAGMILIKGVSRIHALSCRV